MTEEKKEMTLYDIYESMNDEQKNLLHYLVGFAVENGRKFRFNTDAVRIGDVIILKETYDNLSDIQKRFVDEAVKSAMKEKKGKIK